MTSPLLQQMPERETSVYKDGTVFSSERVSVSTADAEGAGIGVYRLGGHCLIVLTDPEELRAIAKMCEAAAKEIEEARQHAKP